MKTLSVLAMTAALIATGASAQGVSEQNHGAIAARSDVGYPTDAAKRSASPRGSNSFASAPAARTREARTRSASSTFDGEWSVLIQTQVGDCDRAYRYGVQIQNGQILNGGGEAVSLEGRVAPNGAVRVRVAAGNQEADGAGRLSRSSGGGTWRGQGSLGSCAGTWVAERRE
jgi:hypothetical protein